MTKVHGKRYAYKFDFRGLDQARQQQSAPEGRCPPDFSFLAPYSHLLGGTGILPPPAPPAPAPPPPYWMAVSSSASSLSSAGIGGPLATSSPQTSVSSPAAVSPSVSGLHSVSLVSPLHSPPSITSSGRRSHGNGNSDVSLSQGAEGNGILPPAYPYS